MYSLKNPYQPLTLSNNPRLQTYLNQRQLPTPIVPTTSNANQQFTLQNKVYHNIDTNVVNRYKVQPPTYQTTITNKSTPKDYIKTSGLFKNLDKDFNPPIEQSNTSTSSLLIPIILTLLIL